MAANFLAVALLQLAVSSSIHPELNVSPNWARSKSSLQHLHKNSLQKLGTIRISFHICQVSLYNIVLLAFLEGILLTCYLMNLILHSLIQGCPVSVLEGHYPTCLRCFSALIHLIWRNEWLTGFCRAWWSPEEMGNNLNKQGGPQGPALSTTENVKSCQMCLLSVCVGDHSQLLPKQILA